MNDDNNDFQIYIWVFLLIFNDRTLEYLANVCIDNFVLFYI